jgi:hypothetical protein
MMMPTGGFKFRIHMVCKCRLRYTRSKDAQNNKNFHVIGKGYTTGMSRFFFKVDDLYESYIEKNQGILPIC